MRRRDFIKGIGGSAVGWPLAASAEPSVDAYPSKTIRVLVPGSAGTPPDIIARIVATQMSEDQGWRVIVEDKPGAIGTIGLKDALKEPADGYTVAAVSLPIAAAPALLPEVGIRPDKDFTPVIKLASAYHVFVVTPSFPVRTVGELVALLKSNPDKYTFSSGGFGTPAHLAGEMFMLETGVRARHVPYGQLPRAIADLVNGTNQFQIITPLPVVGLIGSGDLRAIAVAGPARLKVLKDVPTVGEEGFPDLIIQDWFGLLVKRGTSEDIVVRLNAAANKALNNTAVRERIEKMAAEPAGGTSAEFASFLTAQVNHWSDIITRSGIKMPQ
jgi:tripartite-type tricarboxylate transporter receptor subunit TctC